MKRTLLIGIGLTLTGCVTTLDNIRDREVQDDIVTSRPLPQVRDCLLAKLGAVGRTPMTLGDERQAEVMFSVGPAGVVFHYTLTAVANGTRVEARRKNNIADGFKSGQLCYQ